MPKEKGDQRKRKPEPRQAVIVIHGIGEQRPMDTLRDFTEAVAPPNQDPNKPPFFSKPDQFSDSFELRRLTAHRQKDTFKTDYFEFYWAHLMQGTQIRDIVWWVWTMFVRWPWTIPKRLRWIFFVFWGTIVLAAGITFVINYRENWLPGFIQCLMEKPWFKPAMSFLVTIISLLINGLLLGYLGDAVRYFTPRPRNVPEREKIRKAGIALLKRLHEAKNDDGSHLYDRIILVGHSLGSVIAYDLLYLFWNQVNTRLDLAIKDIDKAESAASDFRKGSIDLEVYRKSQFDFWLAQHKNENSWRISDLITAGSPLAFADLHLADGAKKLEAKQNQREFPTCPPRMEAPTATQLTKLKDKSKLEWFSFPASDKADQKRTLHHAAPFAMTRWTNLSFKNDYVGGDVSCFGTGVQNGQFIATSYARLFTLKLPFKRRLPFQSHTHYWDKEETESLGYLRKNMSLTFQSLGAPPPENEDDEDADG